MTSLNFTIRLFSQSVLSPTWKVLSVFWDHVMAAIAPLGQVWSQGKESISVLPSPSQRGEIAFLF